MSRFLLRAGMLALLMLCVSRFLAPPHAPGDAQSSVSQSSVSQSSVSQSSASQSSASQAGTSESSAAPTEVTDDAVLSADPAATPDASATVEPVAAKSKLTRLDPKAEVWVDGPNRRVIVGGSICLRSGQLEMFACPKGTKEHESIVAVNAPAYLIHAALLSIGARNGHPVQYEPVYRAAEGSEIRVDVIWKTADSPADTSADSPAKDTNKAADTAAGGAEKGKVMRIDARQLIRHVREQKPLATHWVVAGSNFWQDETTGERFYQAEGGELICLSNFSTATLDLPVLSPHDNADLLYEAWTERIPPLGTRVRLVLSESKEPK